ncbi:MAG: ABC transporter ATP-binding protein [Lachnospiraceae bacterium]|nr:ABC transporter ATP-binding protein [Clostridiales bacterium]MBR6850052.1 ABC transporter ATP-binding protein [Lachnospiraceae bacterium]
MSDNPALSIQNLTKTFGKKVAVDNVSFDVYPGEVFGFLGPNGAGKTTIIKSVMGFIQPDKGTIVINGHNAKKEYEKAMSSIGGIVENPEMYSNLSAYLNLKMYAKLHDNISKERIDEVLELVGLKERAKEPVKKYSLGMKQRIGLAQALLHKPRMLILDEPTNGLDPAGIHQLRDILKKYAHEDGAAVMVSSHLLSEMQMMCDRIGIINHGKLIRICSIEELTDQSTSSSKYRIKTSDPKKASVFLSETYSYKVSNLTESCFDIEVDESEINECVRKMVESGSDILGVQKVETSLEDAFLQITGGGIEIE